MECGVPCAMMDGQMLMLMLYVANLGMLMKVAKYNNYLLLCIIFFWYNVLHEDATARNGAYYGQGSGRIVLDDVTCSGYEDRLIDCTHRGIGVHDCSHYEDAGVVCVPLPNITFVQNS